jgi:hypothetical protein
LANKSSKDVGAAGSIATPLLQTSFLPDLMHVNFAPDAVFVELSFVQMAPTFTAPLAGKTGRSAKAKVIDRPYAIFFIFECALMKKS